MANDVHSGLDEAWWGALTFLCFFNYFLIIACRLHIFCVKEYNDSSA